MDLPPHRDLGERVRAALARRGAGALHEAEGEEGGCRVRAFLAGPDESTNTTRNTFLFVGGRFVRDRNLLHALSLGYGPLLEKGRYPMAALFIDVPGADVDVNVHPQKLEVRFARAQEVYAAVRHVVGAAIARAPWLRTTDDRPMRTFTQPPRAESAAGAPLRPVRVGAGAMALPRSAQSSLPLRARDADDPISLTAAGAVEPAAARAPGFFAGLNYVGQVHRTYLVCEAAAELILIDQHAAHERVAYARLRAAHARRQMPRQQLLFPIPIEVGDAAAAALETDDVLGGLGFEVARQGPGVILLRAVPEPLKDADPKPLIRELLSDLADGTPLREGELDRVDHLLATIACHSVVRAGDVLGRPEALALLNQLDGVDLSSHCPHGRPVLLRMPLGEIERRFGRV
jgi:DNA mismatch repair protein MutL